jgi:predicted oxidoreductase
VAADLGTFAGVRTDTCARVLGQDGRIVPGLYAVGNDMASVMGGAYPGAGAMLGAAMTFGYVAGCHLAGVETD